MEFVLFFLKALFGISRLFGRRNPKKTDSYRGRHGQTYKAPIENKLSYHPQAKAVNPAVPQVRLQKSKALSSADVKENIYNFSKVKVQHVIDGDTIIVGNSWLPTKIRLDSIDCPEDGQPWGNIATAGLIKMIGGRHVRLEEHGQDVHGRTLATVYVFITQTNDWINVNERMVMLGHAWVMRSFYDHLPEDRKKNLNRLESWSKSKNVGLWGTENPTPPWLWRKGPKIS